MSAREISRFNTTNDSNIPILKKTLARTQKSRGCSKLPEFQKYIQTIIKATKEFDSDETSFSDKEKFPKGNHAVCKGFENKISHEKLKFDVISNKRKIKRQTSKKYSDAVSRGVEVLHRFFSEFEDPRNWKARNSGSHLKIEKLIEKVYPNPYTMRWENSKRHNSETQIIFEKIKKDDLKENTLYNIYISKVDAETQDNLENANFDLLSADFHIMLSERDNKTTKSDMALNIEKLNESLSHNKIKSMEKKHSKLNALKLNIEPSTPNNLSSITSSIYVNNNSDRASSAESISTQNQNSYVNNKKIKSNTKINFKETLSQVKKSKPLKKVNDNFVDYDLGKLKLLNFSDSDASMSKNCRSEETQNKNNIATDDFVKEISSEICNEISKTNDLNDLLQIYEVMNKATESFLYLTSMKKPGSDNGKSDENPDFLNQNYVESSKVQNFDSVENENSFNSKKNSTAEEINAGTETKSQPESLKIDICDNEDDIVMSMNLSDCEETKRKDENEIFDANQKINEVLEFMNDCLLKFSNDDTVLLEKKNHEKDDEKKILSENVLNDSVGDEKHKTSTSKTNIPDLVTESSSVNTKEPLINLLEAPEKLNKNQNARIRCKRKSKVTSISSVDKTDVISQQLVNRNEASTSYDNVLPIAESIVINNENVIQVAESQNELGGYAEEPLDTVVKEDCRVLKKSVFPLSTSGRRSQPETYKTLKDALETEEKLLKLSKREPKKIVTCILESQLVMPKNTIPSYSPMDGFQSLNSSFVFCITPLTQNLKTAEVIPPSLSTPKPLSLSLIDFTSWNLKPLPREYPIEKFFTPSEIEHKTSKYMYSFKLEMLIIVNNTKVIYYAKPICFTAFMSFSKVEYERFLEHSKRQIRLRPLNKFSIVNLNTPQTSGFCIRNTVTITASKSNLLHKADSRTNINSFNQPVETLLKTIQETENIFLLQRHNSSENNTIDDFESSYSCKTNELLKREVFDSELEKKKDKEKVQNLLLRTYKLQKKLQQYLHGLTQPVNLSHSFMRQDLDINATEETSDISIINSNLQPKRLPSLTDISLHLPTAEKETKTNKSLSVNVQMVDHSTTYFPPSVEPSPQICEKQNKLNHSSKNLPFLEKEEETSPDLENDEDDRSSTCSFKSSNDFSETNELHDEQKNVIIESPGNETSKNVLKKIFSHLKLLKESVDSGNSGKQQKNNVNFKKEEDLKINELVESDLKNPAKVLKTVFKGRKSSTELTIGLKDVPMTKVRNISVEKTKFSPNHTKISICISKENPNEISVSDNEDCKSISNFFDHVRPSLSMCETKCSKVEDNVSKRSRCLNEKSDDDDDEDDDDDFKSADSTADDSKLNCGSKEEKPKLKNQEGVKMSQTKNFIKHKFDFYRKMDMNVEGLRVRKKSLSNSLWRFKELEPLKQALTELQIRMRSIKREADMNSNDYYERALKLAKMSAGYCQSCGTRAVIPDDTFGYYKSLLPRRQVNCRRNKHFKTNITPNSSFYSFQSSNAEVSGQCCNMDIKGGSSFSLNQTTHSNRTVLRSSLQDMPIFEKM